MKLIQPLQSGKLSLIPIKMSHLDDVFELRSNPEVRKFIEKGSFSTKDQARKFVEKCIRNNEDGVVCQWGLSVATEENIIGTICLWNFSEDKSLAEIGYDLKPAYQGQGWMSKALSMVLTFGRDTLKLNQVMAFTSRENEASIRLLERFAFVHDSDEAYYSKYVLDL